MALTQRKGIDTLAKWAKDSRNSAIEDVMQNIAQLVQMFTDKQLEFTQEYEHCISRLGKIAETELRLESSTAKFKQLEQKEKKLRRSIEKRPIIGSRAPHETFHLCQELNEVAAQRELSARELEEAQAETEIIKMIQFREGIIGIADAYRHLATSCQLIFNCQREIAEFVPAISTQDVRKMLYDGKPFTQERVEEVRRSLDSFELSGQNTLTSGLRRNRSEPSRRFGLSLPHNDSRNLHEFHIGNFRPSNTQGTPPPPYMPSAPQLDALDLSPATPRARFWVRNQKRPTGDLLSKISSKKNDTPMQNASSYGPSGGIYPDLSHFNDSARTNIKN